MWRKFVAPEILFLLGTIQALSPYIIWFSVGANIHYSYEITYLPAAIWMVGYMSFWLGARSIKINSEILFQPPIKISLNSTKFAIWGMSSLIIVQIVWTIRIYGLLPIYGYFTGTANVTEINNLQNESGFGQLGTLSASLFFLNGLLLILIIKGNQIQKKPRLIFLIAFCLEVFGTSMSGKRQGLIICLTFLACGLSMYFGNPLKPLLKFFHLPSSKIVRLMIYSSIIGGFIFLMGFVTSLRVGSGFQISGIDEIFNYLQYPLINLEAQCEEIGLAPYQYNFLYPLLTLLPYKVAANLMPSLNELPIRPEPTIGAGFYGQIHWGLGIIGVIFYSFLFGLISKYFYKKSSTNLVHLLIYCQILWTLLAAHTYNHFFTLIFLPIPAILFFVFCALFNRPNIQQESANL